MRILFISDELIGSAVVHQLIKEQHDVRLYIEHRDRQDCLQNIANQTTDWKQELSWVGTEGLIVFDDVTFGDIPDQLRNAGYRVFGGSIESNQLELNRGYFQSVLTEHGIKTLPSLDFDTPDDAITFIHTNPGPWVLKQNTHISSLNYVGQRTDDQDILDMLQYYKTEGIAPLHLQKKAIGIEIGVGRYFNGSDWVGPIEINMEHKHLMNNNIGPLTAEMGTLMWYETDENQPIFQATLAKLKDFLCRINYKGDIDIGCIVNKEGIWPLESTVRFGTPSTQLQCELQVSPWGDMLKAIADGTPYNLAYRRDYGIVVSIAVPPFPFAPDDAGHAHITTSNGTSLFFTEDFTEEDATHVHFEEISKKVLADGRIRYYVAGKHGYALYVTGHGKTVAEAREKVYSLINKIHLPNMMYRTDIGNSFILTEQAQLTRWGWLS